MAYGADTDVLMDLDEEDDFELIRAEAEARRAAARPPPNPNIEPPELEEGKTHHLFISHSEEEGEWAAQLVETLEQEHGLKCLWPRREFTPGHEIADLIQTGIARSMKVLFIMTPASLESGWCKYERNWAFVLSVEERENRVIPLMLSPCEVPNIFKTINYIDVPKGEDHIHRILRSFDKENDLKHIVPDLETFLKRQVNGLKTEMYGEKRLKWMCNGPAWCFQPPSEYQRYLLRKLGSKFAEDVYHKVKDLVNATHHLRFYALSHSAGHCCAFCCCSVTLVMMAILSLLFIVQLAAQMFLNADTGFTVTVFLLVFIIPIAIFVIDRLNYNRAWNAVLEFSLSQVAKTKVLVYYKKSKCCQPPCLVMMYYDINPCMNYLRDGILRTPNFGDIDDMENRKAAAQTLAESAVLDFLRRSYDMLFTWDKLEISEVNRHATFANKKCLCEMLHTMYWSADMHV